MDFDPLDGIAAADIHLGRPVPLPASSLPLARWVEVVAVGPEAVEVQWNLDDTRPGAPGRLALFAGRDAPADRGLAPGEPVGRYACRAAALEHAEPSLRPVRELAWREGDLHLRLTGQGPWELAALVRIADSVAAP